MSQTIKHDAANQLGAIAEDIQKNEGVSLDRATDLAYARNPELAYRYEYGESNLKKYDLSPLEQQMVALQGDPEQVKRLAGEILDHYAQANASKATGSQTGVVSEETYSAAFRQLTEQYPSLGRAYREGYISGDDWFLLGVLVPSTAGDVERIKGVRPGIGLDTFSKRSDSSRYTGPAVYYKTGDGKEHAFVSNSDKSGVRKYQNSEGEGPWYYKRINGQWREVQV